MISFDCSWFFAKNLCNFVSLSWKLHNRYCHKYEWTYYIHVNFLIYSRPFCVRNVQVAKRFIHTWEYKMESNNFWSFIGPGNIWISKTAPSKMILSQCGIQVNLFQKLATSGEHVVYQNCSECQNKTTICSAGILSLQFSWTMNNLLSYCGLVDAKIRASADKDLPVSVLFFFKF